MVEPVLWTRVFLKLDSNPWKQGVSSTLIRRSEDVWLPCKRLVLHPGSNVVISLLLFEDVSQQLHG